MPTCDYEPCPSPLLRVKCVLSKNTAIEIFQRGLHCENNGNACHLSYGLRLSEFKHISLSLVFLSLRVPLQTF